VRHYSRVHCGDHVNFYVGFQNSSHHYKLQTINYKLTIVKNDNNRWLILAANFRTDQFLFGFLTTLVPEHSLSNGTGFHRARGPCCHNSVKGLKETYTCARLTALFPGLPGWAGTRKVNQSGFYWSKRQWVAVASAGLYTSLQLAPDRKPRQHPTTQIFTGQMPFLPPNQRRQSTEG